MNIVVDENIALAKEAFSEFGNVHLINGRKITNKMLINVDALIVRSITNVSEVLLNKTKIKFVGTATIGTDHIDLNYLKKEKIFFADAKGCNADSVAEYVFTALLKLAIDENIELTGKTIGVVGVGNIGSRVVKIAKAFGMGVLKNDPPLERKGIENNYVSLDEILKADIITLHVPLNKSEKDKTFHLLNEKNLKQLRELAIIINTSRGEIIDNDALLKVIPNKKLNIILDVWENEPRINVDLLKLTNIGTAHIAGYSYEGKINGTKRMHEALCNFIGNSSKWKPKLPGLANEKIVLDDNKGIELKLYNLLSSVYNIEMDDSKLRSIINLNSEERAQYFDQLRKEYPVRREFSSYTVSNKKYDANLKKILRALRFNL